MAFRRIVAAVRSERQVGRGLRAFVSYSRSDAMLVEALGTRLRSKGIDVWIDYEALVPGEDWGRQVDAAVADADVFVLVVSRRAMASRHVADEREQALRHGVPVVLAIAEAAPIDPRVVGAPWVDVQMRTRRSLRRLTELILRTGTSAHDVDGLAPPSPPPPSTERLIPLRVGVATFVSAWVALSSVFALWTIIVPLVLVPLPRRIMRRSFDYVAVRNALLALPVALLCTLFALSASDGSSVHLDSYDALLAILVVVGLLLAPVLFLLIRGGSFRRWVKPVAARPRLQLVWPRADRRTPAPVEYRVDAAVEDRSPVRRIDRALAKHGHERVDCSDATVVLRFVSQFHDIVDIDPAARTIPIVLADADDEIPERLARTQWVDLRRGLRRRQLEALGRHLDEPVELLRTLGSRPQDDGRVFPRFVQGLVVSLWIAVAVMIGLWLLIGIGVRSEIGALTWIAPIAAGLDIALVGAMIWLIRRVELRRPGRLRASPVLMVALGCWLVAVTVELGIDGAPGGDAEETGDLAFLTAVVAGGLLLYFWLFGWRAIRRWLPAKVDQPTGGT